MHNSMITCTQATLMAILFLISMMYTEAHRISPFLSRDEAFQVLGHEDFGKSKTLTAQLGLRADIGDGWEELLRGVQTKDVLSKVDLILQKNRIPKEGMRYLAEKVVFRSPLSSFSYHHLTPITNIDVVSSNLITDTLS